MVCEMNTMNEANKMKRSQVDELASAKRTGTKGKGRKKTTRTAEEIYRRIQMASPSPFPVSGKKKDRNVKKKLIGGLWSVCAQCSVSSSYMSCYAIPCHAHTPCENRYRDER